MKQLDFILSCQTLMLAGIIALVLWKTMELVATCDSLGRKGSNEYSIVAIQNTLTTQIRIKKFQWNSV